MKHSIHLVFGTRRGIGIISRNGFILFGVFSGILQLIMAMWPKAVFNRWGMLILLAVVCLIFGIVRAWPRKSARREFTNPDITITVKVGDLFDQNTHLIIGFNDMFDTDTTNGVVIDSNSIQGQFQNRFYPQDLARLNLELDTALSGQSSTSVESRADKVQGKLDRYPIGTVAKLGNPAQYFFCVAYSKMRNDLITKSSVDFLWDSLSKVWQEIFLHGQRRPVSIPIVGSELARINCLDRESLLRMILLSFVARARQDIVCKELTVVIHEKDYTQINMLEVEAFLKTL